MKNHIEKFSKMLPTALFLTVGALFVSCRTSSPSSPEPTPADNEKTSTFYLPKARIYRTSCDCPELVPVRLSQSGTSVVSYPSPTDLTLSSEPIALADGWWLDRVGISPDSRFTTYTFSQYCAMGQAPSLEELLSHIDSECRITEIRALPLSVGEAAADTAAVNNIIRNRIDDCATIYSTPVLKK